MGLETIIAGIVAAVVAVIAAFAAGNYKGRTKGVADERIRANNDETKRVVESNNQAVQTQLNAANAARTVNDEVSNLPVGSAADELRRDYARDNADGNKNG